MAIGTETEGSICNPATRQSLWAVKPTLGSVPNAHIMPVSHDLDIPGPMCRSVLDTANLLTVLKSNSKDNIASGGYTAAMKGANGWTRLSAGMVDPDRF